jgi:streptogramin lyase
MGPYDPPKPIKTEVAAVLPERFTRAGSRPGKVSSRYARPQVGVDCYLEGPSFDRNGHLYFLALAGLSHNAQTHPTISDMAAWASPRVS